MAAALVVTNVSPRTRSGLEFELIQSKSNLFAQQVQSQHHFGVSCVRSIHQFPAHTKDDIEIS